jgi:chromosome segregation ATPase
MDKETIVASLKNDISKLEKHINQINTDLRVSHEEMRTVDMSYSMYKKEMERNYDSLKTAFIELLDLHIQYKYKNNDIDKSQITEITYLWMEKSGIL